MLATYGCIHLLAFVSPAHAQVIAVKSGPEIAEFGRAQRDLLSRYGIKAQSRFVKLARPSLTAHVLVAGKGDPVLLIHGGGGFAAQFAPVMASLHRHYQVYAVDRPGCGLTDKFDYRNTALRQHAVDFIGSVLDGLKLKKAALAGASMGGLWALQFALAKPERVSVLALLGEPAGAPSVMTNAPPRWSGSPGIEAIRAGIGARQVADIARVPNEYVEAALAARRLPGADRSWNTLIDKFTKDDQRTYQLRPELGNLRPPTIYLWGDQDRLGPPSLGEEMAHMSPDARCVAIKNAGHLVWMDEPEVCGYLLIGFFRSKRP